jgi:DNA repair protein RAD50
VHDPRSIGSSVVKANLKLRFTNGAGKPMVIVRSMEVTQKKTTMSFKQLDGVLRATDRTGNRVSMSHKCTELDRQIPLLLGVSKAILENVVFCHQEDASWPLQEGIVLKKKFDDIFDSTRYSKALEIFAKAKKEYVLKTKDHKADVAELRSHRHAAQGFRREVQEHTELLEQLEDQLASGRQALEENAVEQQKVEDLLEETAAADERLDSKQRDMLSERRDLITKRDAMTEDLTDRFDEAELTEQLSTFDSQKESHEEKKRDLDEKKRACEQELASIQKEQKDLQSEVGRLQAGKETHQDNLRKRYEKMCEVGQAYGLEAMLTPFSQNSQLGSATSGRLSSTQDTIYSRHPTQGDESPGKGAKEHGEGDVILDIPQEDIKQYFRAVENKKEELQDQLSTQKSKIREQEDELNNDLSDLKAKVKSIENKKKDLYAEESKTRAELDRIRRNQRGMCTHASILSFIRILLPGICFIP